MKLLSINLGKKQEIDTGKPAPEDTGIFKTPVEGPVMVGALGLEGDFIASAKHHGGPDQAVYIYGMGDYDFWREELGERIAPGLFGENLTISGLESAQFNVGDILHVGDVRLQVTAPRFPCSKFAAKMGDPHFVKKFKQAERMGLYCRVLVGGEISAGDRVTVESYTGETVSILEMTRDHYTPDNSAAGLRRFLAAPIDVRTREKKEKALRELR